MRHAHTKLALPVGALAMTVCLLARFRSLVTVARCQDLPSPHALPAGITAIALAPVATATHSKHRVALGVEASTGAKDIKRRFLRSSHSCHYTRYAEDRTDDSAFGAMMLLPCGQSLKNDDF
jgi:hypothetical protein